MMMAPSAMIRHRIVVALVVEAPLRIDCSTSRRLQSDISLDRIAVASPQWENGLTFSVKCFVDVVA
jgi:hypothetical protein